MGADGSLRVRYQFVARSFFGSPAGKKCRQKTSHPTMAIFIVVVVDLDFVQWGGDGQLQDQKTFLRAIENQLGFRTTSN